MSHFFPYGMTAPPPPTFFLSLRCHKQIFCKQIQCSKVRDERLTLISKAMSILMVYYSCMNVGKLKYGHCFKGRANFIYKHPNWRENHPSDLRRDFPHFKVIWHHINIVINTLIMENMVKYTNSFIQEKNRTKILI